MFGLFKSKPAADPMAVVQTDATMPTTKEPDKVIARYKRQADLWKRVSANVDKARLKAVSERDEAIAELARLKAARERSNANLAAANALRRARAKAANA